MFLLRIREGARWAVNESYSSRTRSEGHTMKGSTLVLAVEHVIKCSCRCGLPGTWREVSGGRGVSSMRGGRVRDGFWFGVWLLVSYLRTRVFLVLWNWCFGNSSFWVLFSEYSSVGIVISRYMLSRSPTWVVVDSRQSMTWPCKLGDNTLNLAGDKFVRVPVGYRTVYRYAYVIVF